MGYPVDQATLYAEQDAQKQAEKEASKNQMSALFKDKQKQTKEE
jgi:hypothetical protein